MLKQHQRFFTILFQIFDLFLVLLAWVISYPIRFLYLTPWFPPNHGIPSFKEYAYLGIGIVGLWFIVFLTGGLYRSVAQKKSELN